MKDPLVAAFESLCARRPEQPLVLSAGRASLSVSGLDSLARAIAERPSVRALGAGTLVGVSSPGGASFLACVLALRRAGAAVLLLDTSGPASSVKRTARALGAKALLGCDDRMPESAGAFRFEPLVPDPKAPPLRPKTAFLKTTSGSSGRPRAVAVSCEAMLADEEALARTMGIVESDRIVAAVPLSHSYGFASVALPALVRGTALVLPDESGPLSPIAAAREACATVFPTAPAYLGALLRMSRPPSWPSSLRLVISAGAPLPPETAVRFRERTGRRVHVFYGASECGGICYDREGGAGERGTVGAPVAGVRITLEPLEHGRGGDDEGLVVVASAAAGEGYVPEPEPERLGGGRFRTSDVGRLKNGELQLLRRADTVINVKGKKVDPAEIEATLSALRGVEEVVAVGVSDPRTGASTVRVVIACRPGRLTRDDVLRFCRSELAEHKVPRSIRLVPEIPRTARGKIDRGTLAGRS